MRDHTVIASGSIKSFIAQTKTIRAVAVAGTITWALALSAGAAIEVARRTRFTQSRVAISITANSRRRATGIISSAYSALVQWFHDVRWAS